MDDGAVIQPEAKVINFADLIGKKAKRRSEDHWGAAVMARGFTILPSILFWAQGRLDLTPEEFNVLVQLASHWWDANDNPHPSKERLAERIGKNPRTIQRYLTQLEKKGFIGRLARFRANKGQTSNGYALTGLVEKLAALEPEFKKVTEQNRLRRQKVERPVTSAKGA
jgi:hypothetical protein